MRGIGVAVMCRTCGARPSTSAERCSTPKRCCSSTTATARSRNSTPFWISACVPTTTSRLAADLRLDRAGEERAADAELHADPLDREEVLLGERLGRRHQRALPPGLDRAQERVERDDRLARADVALEQPLHRRRPGEVGVDLGDRLLLVLGQLERERRAVAARSARPARGSAAATCSLALGRPARERELEHEQLVEGEPLPPLLRLLERARLVDRDERVAPGAAVRAAPSAVAGSGSGRSRDERRARPRRAPAASPPRSPRSPGRPARSRRSRSRRSGRTSGRRSRTGSARRAGARACPASASPAATAG